MKKLAFFCFFIACTNVIWAQQKEGQTEAITGFLLDKSSKKPIADGRLELLNFTPPKVVSVLDSSGKFKMQGVPVGRYRVLASASNYESEILYDVVVAAGKETVLEIALEEIIKELGNKTTNTPSTETPKVLLRHTSIGSINTFSTVGAISFSMDEVNRFSGSRSDIARLITGTGGIMNSDDGRNDIIARGGTPLGIQWRVEGMPVINPNHFGYMTTTAGYFPIININCMANSEFLLGTFSAEYGNSTSGVFDINLRSGNKNRYEFMAGVSILNGAEFMAEGPFNKRKNSSFLVAGRYSILKPLSSAVPFLNFGTSALPDMWDINFKLDFGKFGNNKHELTMFGFGGFATIFYDHRDLTDDDAIIEDSNKDQYAHTQNGAGGLTHRFFMSNRSYWQTTLGTAQGFEENYADFYVPITDSTQLKYRGVYYTIYNGNYTLNSFINTKFSPKYSMRNGISADLQTYRLYETSNRHNLIPSIRHNTNGSMLLAEAYHQSQYRFNASLTMVGGVHGMYLSLNKSWAIDPRFSLIYDINTRHRISFGYAMQHQQLPQRIYFYRALQINALEGTSYYDESSRNLPMWGNHYLNLEYTWRFTEFWQFKISPYYRFWFNIPVQADAMSGYSLYNNYSQLPDDMPTNLLKTGGTAQNYGVDMSIQKRFNLGYYLSVAGSWFTSTYTGSDQKTYNSRFNRRYIGRLRAGKEFKVGKLRNNLFFINTTFTIAGGERDTPIDLLLSQVYDDDVYSQNYFSTTTPVYYRWDIKIGMRINSKKKRISHYFYIDGMNVTSHNNVLRYQYINKTGTIRPSYQMGFLPDVLYRIQF